MRLIFTPYNPLSTRFGIFHNLDETGEETGYASLHLFGARMSLYWLRR